MNLECGDRHIQEYFKVEPEFDFLKSRKLLFSGSDTNYIDVQNDDWGSSQAEGKSLNIIQIFESTHGYILKRLVRKISLNLERLSNIYPNFENFSF